MYRSFIIAFVIAIMVSSCQVNDGNQSISREIEAESGAVIEHPAGIKIDIPQNGLYEDTEISVSVINKPEEVDSQNYFIPEKQVYIIEISGEGFFNLPVEISIPYDPSLLPDNRTEADIFPVYEYEGVWYRGEGDVDRTSQVVRATTLHNGFWSWAVDPIVENWVQGPVLEFYCEEGSDSETLAQAKLLLQSRTAELDWVLEDARFRVDQVKIPSEDIFNFIVGEFQGKYAETYSIARSSQIAKITGGKSAIVYLGDVKLGAWIGRLEAGMKFWAVGEAGLIIGKEAYGIGDVAFQIKRLKSAYDRWYEAKSLVKILEDGCMVKNLPPDMVEALNQLYDVLPIENRSNQPREIDFNISAHTEPEVSDIVIPEPYNVIFSSFEEALQQTIIAATNNDAREWFPLINPDLDNEERKNIARGLYTTIRPYTLSCISYQRGEVGNFSDGALVIFKASSLGGDSDKLYRITIGKPLDSNVYYYAPYFRTWQEWNEKLNNNITDNLTPCPDISFEEDTEENIQSNYTNYDEFLSAVMTALQTYDLKLADELTYRENYYWGDTDGKTYTREPGEFSHYLIYLVKRYDVNEIIINEGDTNCIPGEPIFAEHTIIIDAQIYSGPVCIGFGFVEGRYYLTEMWNFP